MTTNEKLHEACAVFGVSITEEEAPGMVYNGLLALQHRGQEGAGIAVAEENKIFLHKDLGLVCEVFANGNLDRLPKGSEAVGHTRYSTTGTTTRENTGPFISEYVTGRIAMAHNGNITNADAIRRQLEEKGIAFYATSDSEVATWLLAYEVSRQGDLVTGIIKGASQLEGAFSLILLCGNGGLIAIRDANGYRPLCIGRNQYGYAVASESCAFDSVGFQFVRDVLPGEMIIIEKGQITFEQVVLSQKEPGAGLCIFEYVYFARPDSLLDRQSVWEARFHMGKRLAKEYPVEADVVCGVPDSGLEAAMGYSRQSGIPFVSGFVKNRYIGRSFIYPTQLQRQQAVKMKLNPLSVNVRGKRVVLVDDSIVRGTTIAQIVTSLKQAGALTVHVRISSPPFRYTCHYGTDLQDEKDLIANEMSLDQICQAIGADSLGYISIDGLIQACQNSQIRLCTKCFTGNKDCITEEREE